MIEKYIREQEADNQIRDSVSKQEYVDPFKQLKRDRAMSGWWSFKKPFYDVHPQKLDFYGVEKSTPFLFDK